MESTSRVVVIGNFLLICYALLFMRLILFILIFTFSLLFSSPGGGIHGVSTAFYLAKLGVRSLIIEQTGIASAASGKAGGFLARDWGDGPTVPLHEISFEMHQKLAAELDVKSYRLVKTLEVNGNRKAANVASWLDKKASSELMDQRTAQVKLFI